MADATSFGSDSGRVPRLLGSCQLKPPRRKQARPVPQFVGLDWACSHRVQQRTRRRRGVYFDSQAGFESQHSTLKPVLLSSAAVKLSDQILQQQGVRHEDTGPTHRFGTHVNFWPKHRGPLLLFAGRCRNSPTGI